MQIIKTEEGKVRTPALVALVVALHGVVAGAILFSQGCGTTRGRQQAEPPPAPMMPPHADIETAPAPITPRPTYQPPVAIESLPSSVESAGGQTYKIEKGDSLSKIASRYGVSAREIAELNGIKDPNKIRIGQKILLPAYANLRHETHAKSTKAAAVESKSSSSKSASGGAGDYEVQPGDSLSKIAARHGVTVKALREANHLKSDMIRVKQKLVIPGGKKTKSASESAPAPAPTPAPTPAVEPTPAASTDAAPATAVSAVSGTTSAAPATTSAAPTPFEYVMRPGETLDDVARNFAVLKSEIVSVNGITDESKVKEGTKLKIPLSSSVP